MMEYPFDIDFINIENYYYPMASYVTSILADYHHIMVE